VFLVLVSAISLAITYLTYNFSDVRLAMSKMEDSDLWMETALTPAEATPAMVISPLAVCNGTSGSAETIKNQLSGFAKNNFYMVGLLYVATFALSMVYGYFQKAACYEFDKANLSMADFAIRVTGLPKERTSEADLAEFFQGALRKALPDKVKRPDEVIHKGMLENDEVKPRKPSQIEIYGVSVCYDYTSKWDEVDDVMWKLIEQMEVDMHNKAKFDPWTLNHLNTSAASQGMTLEDVDEMCRKKVTAWFQGDNRLKGSGEAFLVFRYLQDKVNVMQYAEDHPGFLRHPEAPETALALNNVFSEPPTVAWWFVGLPDKVVVRKTVRNVLYCLLMILIVQIAIVAPYAWFILWPYSNTGSTAGGAKMAIMGIVLGNVNGLLFMTNFMTAVHVGYPRKDRMDSFVLFTNTILCFVNTVFNIVTIVIMVLNQLGVEKGLDDFFQVQTLKWSGTENALARNLYSMMMPGAFFVGLIMSMIMAGWVPWTVNTLLMKIIYVWQCLPTCLLRAIKIFLPYAPEDVDFLPFRSAEKAFEPWEVAICGNYADHIVTPSICFFFLFFCSPYVYKAFLGMLLWALFECIFFRYMHLRYCKCCFYTTNRLDTFSNFLWGIPVSVIAAACCHWAFKSGRLPASLHSGVKLAVLFGVFFASWALYAGCYQLLIQPWVERDAVEDNLEVPIEDLKKETVYSWFNCNPVYVLKCKYFFQDKDGKDLPDRRKGHPLACGEDSSQVRFFEIGRQHLFIKPERQRLVHVHENDITEFETWFELVVRLFGLLADPLGRKAAREALVGELLVPVDESQRGLLDATPSEHKSNGTT